MEDGSTTFCLLDLGFFPADLEIQSKCNKLQSRPLLQPWKTSEEKM
jgi:hypothetical protein